jgi:CheY-like chemotaxis protein
MQTYNILVIDDDPDFFRSLGLMLKGLPYSLHSASDAHKGLERVRLLKPDLVILDLMLPDRDGFAVCREIKDNAATSHIPVLMATGQQSFSHDRYLARIAKSHRADGYIDKPVSRKDLTAEIERLIKGAGKPEGAAPGERKVLVVDDDPDHILSMERILKTQGWNVYVAESGLEGIKMARTFHPDLVLLDVMMPDMDGFTACLEIKKDRRTHNIPVILVTSVADEFDEPEYPKSIAENHQADGFIAKPVETEELLSKISDILGL